MYTGGNVQILEHAELFEYRCGLECTTKPQTHDFVGPHRKEILVSKHCLAGASYKPGEGIDQRGLTGSVRADQEMQPSLEKGEVNIVDCLETSEVDRQVTDLQIVLSHERDGHVIAANSAW